MAIQLTMMASMATQLTTIMASPITMIGQAAVDRKLDNCYTGVQPFESLVYIRFELSTCQYNGNSNDDNDNDEDGDDENKCLTHLAVCQPQ